MRHGIRLDPVRDWLVLMSLAGIALACIVVLNMWTFDTVAGGGIIGGQASSTPSLVSQESIDAVRAVFDARTAEEAKYVTGTYRFSDPSR